jgi:hypothetical protein
MRRVTPRGVRATAAAFALAALLGFFVAFAPRSVAAAPPAASDPAGMRADARLGYDAAAVLDLISTPNVLFSDDGQRFVDAAFAELEAQAPPGDRARLVAVRGLLRASPSAAFDPAETARAYRVAVAAVVASLGGDRFGSYSLANLAASVAFNARVLREESTDVDFRRAIGSATPAIAAVPGVSAARDKLAGDAPDAWDAIAADADALAGALLGTAPAPPRPASAATVWALLVRGRPLTGDGPRAGTSHAAIEILYGDGRRRTIAAYPNGRDDFSVATGRLVCAFDLEPATGPSQAFPLVAPRNVTYEDLAARLIAACTAFDKRRPAFRYVPQDDAHANDDAFVFDVLQAESIEMPRP